MPIPGLYDAYQRWAGQTVWVYSDPHFGDQDLAAGVANRPSDLDHVKLINACVGKKDTLICLGDVGDLAYVRQLRGYKVLIMGNHDAGATNYKRETKQFNFKQDEYSYAEIQTILQAKYPDWKITIAEAAAALRCRAGKSSVSRNSRVIYCMRAKKTACTPQ